MKRPLRVLVVEDNPDDAQLLLRELHRAGYEPVIERVQTAEALRAALEQVWDVVISDHSLPSFDGMQALELVKASAKDLPFIMVSGTIGEDRAAAVMRAGAHDFVSKGQLSRLPAAIEREVSEAKMRAARRSAEAAFNDANQELTALVAGSPIGIFCDRDGRMVRWNPACELIFGLPAATIIGQTLDWLPEPVQAEYVDLRDQVLKGSTFTAFETNWNRRDGTRIAISLSMAPLRSSDSKVRGILHLVADITDRRHLEQQLLQTQKVEVVGKLAGGIAHDFNNLLTVINGRAQMMVDKMDPADPLRQYARLIHQVGERAARLTGQLLAFSRRQVFQIQVLDLNGVVVEAEKMLRTLLGEDIELVTRLEMEIPWVQVDRSQLEQVILNLAVNARDAMPSGGILTIATTQVAPAELKRRGIPCSKDCVVLTVSDSGHGMDVAMLSRIFDPFFTTKSAGTGLGLATVEGIVKQSGGHIRVSSEIDIGTVFTIYLPAVRALPRQKESSSLHLAANREPETILVVEDNDEVRDITRAILQECGFQVDTAGTWAEALAAVEQRGGAIDLLLTDVIMPQMSGRELAQRLASICPRLQVLYMSGYTDRLLGPHGGLDPGIDLIQKPFQAKALVRAVRKALNRRAPPA